VYAWNEDAVGSILLAYRLHMDQTGGTFLVGLALFPCGAGPSPKTPAPKMSVHGTYNYCVTAAMNRASLGVLLLLRIVIRSVYMVVFGHVHM
jgi:hypothetical protein